MIDHLQVWTCLVHGTILRETSTGVTLLSTCPRTLSMQGKRKSHFAIETLRDGRFVRRLAFSVSSTPSLTLPDVSPLGANLS
jgi:hypothetical protein